MNTVAASPSQSVVDGYVASVVVLVHVFPGGVRMSRQYRAIFSFRPSASRSQRHVAISLLLASSLAPYPALIHSFSAVGAAVDPLVCLD